MDLKYKLLDVTPIHCNMQAWLRLLPDSNSCIPIMFAISTAWASLRLSLGLLEEVKLLIIKPNFSKNDEKALPFKMMQQGQVGDHMQTIPFTFHIISLA